MADVPPTYSPGKQPASPNWVYGREGWPPSPGLTFTEPPPHPPLTARQEWFKDRKLGMFVHWGLDSLLWDRPEVAREANGNQAWDPASVPDLGRLGEAFDPAVWVDLAERAGMRYLAFTTKHHIGVANFDSKLSPHTTVRLPPHRDFVRLVADECHRRGLPFVAYLSLTDSRHPDFRPLDPAAWARYADFLWGQIEELAAGYGPIAAFWLDPGPWNGPGYHYPVAEIQARVHERWPDTLCFDWDEAEQTFANRAWLDGRGMVMASDVIPPAGPQPGDWPLEVCDTLNRTWFYNPADREYKDPARLIANLVEIVGRGGNYLLNHGPFPSGEINPEDRWRLEALGDWLDGHGESIYGTRPLGLPDQGWGWPVTKGDRVYLHILRWPGERLVLPGRLEVQSARWLGGEEIPFEATAEGVALGLPAQPVEELDSVAILA